MLLCGKKYEPCQPLKELDIGCIRLRFARGKCITEKEIFEHRKKYNANNSFIIAFGGTLVCEQTPSVPTALEARWFVEVISEVVEKQFDFSLVFVVLSFELFPFFKRQDFGRG